VITRRRLIQTAAPQVIARPALGGISQKRERRGFSGAGVLVSAEWPVIYQFVRHDRLDAQPA
jgi:hypothetical protein